MTESDYVPSAADLREFDAYCRDLSGLSQAEYDASKHLNHQFFTETAPKLRTKISTNPTLRIFRLLLVENIPALKHGSPVGQHWTDAWGMYDLQLDFMRLKPDAKMIVLHGMVPPHDINLPATLAYRLLFPEEKEIFLDKGTVVTLEGISVYPSSEFVADNDVWRGLKVKT